MPLAFYVLDSTRYRALRLSAGLTSGGQQVFLAGYSVVAGGGGRHAVIHLELRWRERGRRQLVSVRNGHVLTCGFDGGGGRFIVGRTEIRDVVDSVVGRRPGHGVRDGGVHALAVGRAKISVFGGGGNIRRRHTVVFPTFGRVFGPRRRRRHRDHDDWTTVTLPAATRNIRRRPSGETVILSRVADYPYTRRHKNAKTARENKIKTNGKFIERFE